jgi:sec-independent protein translocase protein TatA
MEYFALLGGIGTPELLLILAIVLLLFGGKKLPELSRAAGQSISELRKGIKESKPEQTRVAVAENENGQQVEVKSSRDARV